MVQLACERPEKLEAKSFLGALRPRFSLSLAVIEDDDADFQTITLMLKQASLLDAKTIRFRNVDEFLKTSDGTFHVILLDRFIQRAGISEDRIREIKALHPDAGVIMYTSSDCPSLRSNAVQEGAMAVVEKGSLSPSEFELLLMTAGCLGAKVSN